VPIFTDFTEKPMFNRIPFLCARMIMTYRYRYFKFISNIGLNKGFQARETALFDPPPSAKMSDSCESL
jgi:hypothetical protein